MTDIVRDDELQGPGAAALTDAALADAAPGDRVTSTRGAAAPVLEDPPRRRSVGPWLMVLLGVALTVWCLPWLVTSLGWQQQAAYMVLPPLPPGATIESGSLGWMSPVHLKNVRIPDYNGETLLELDHVTSVQSLWDLATSPRRLGRWELEKPRLTLRAGAGEFNLNEVLKRFLRKPGSGASTEIELELSDGEIELRDSDDRLVARMTDIQGGVQHGRAGGSIDLSGTFVEPQGAGGMLLSGTWSAGPKDVGPSGDLQAQLDRWPLVLFEPLLAEAGVVDELEGEFSATWTATISPQPQGDAEFSTQLRVAPLELTMRQAGQADVTPWRMDEGVVNAKGRWRRADERVEIAAVQCRSPLVNADASGTIDDPSGECFLSLQGQVDYDVAPLLESLRPDLRRHIVVTGLRLQQVIVRGPMRPDEGRRRSSAGDAAESTQAGAVELDDEASGDNGAPGEQLAVGADLTWEAAEAFGVVIEPGTVRAELSNDQVVLTPQDVAVSGGRLLSLPRIVLERPEHLLVSPGPMVADVQLTPAMTRSWLRFVSPLMARATSIEGEFTLQVDEGLLPLQAPDRAELGGVLHLRRGRVGPSRMARAALAMADKFQQLVARRPLDWDREDAWMELPEQDVSFQLRDGRVFHDEMTFLAGDLTIQTRGSVGLDESLDLLLTMPVPDAWVGRGPVLSSLQGQRLQVGVRGSLEEPRVDARPLADFGKRTGLRAAAGLLQNLLERRRNRAAERDRAEDEPDESP